MNATRDTSEAAPVQEWLTRAEAADYLRCKPQLIDRLRRTGELPTITIASSRLVRFRRADVEALLGVRQPVA